MTFIVVYDANVLYPAPLRDLLIRLANADLLQAKWTSQILDEVFRAGPGGSARPGGSDPVPCDFPPDALARFGIEEQDADQFALGLVDLNRPMRVSAMLCHVGCCGRTVGVLRPWFTGTAWDTRDCQQVGRREKGARVAKATAADYAWLKDDDWVFCFSLVRGLDQVEVLRRFGGERNQPRTLTLGEAGHLSGSFHAGYPQLILVTKAGGWSVAVEDNGWEGTRPEVLRALSRGTRAVSVHSTVGALGHFNYAVDGEVLVSFELLFPHRRWGSQPDLLLPQVRVVGLDPDRHEPSYDDAVIAALALAEQVTGVHLDPRMLDGPLPAAEIAPLLDDPPACFFLGGEDDVELAAAIDQAAPGMLRRAAATAARHAVGLAQLDHDPLIVEALAAAEAGQARQVDDHSPLGWRIRTWAVEVRIAERVRNSPSASLDAQRREASLLHAAGRDPAPPLKDPSAWLGRAGAALVLRWRAGQAVRAALFADPRTDYLHVHFAKPGCYAARVERS